MHVQCQLLRLVYSSFLGWTFLLRRYSVNWESWEWRLRLSQIKSFYPQSNDSSTLTKTSTTSAQHYLPSTTSPFIRPTDEPTLGFLLIGPSVTGTCPLLLSPASISSSSGRLFCQINQVSHEAIYIPQSTVPHLSNIRLGSWTRLEQDASIFPSLISFTLLHHFTPFTLFLYYLSIPPDWLPNYLGQVPKGGVYP